MRKRKADRKQAQRVPEVVLDRRVPNGEHLGGKPGPERMSAKGAEDYCGGAGKRAQEEKRLQAAFFAFFLACPGRFLP
jgi:hypothetical protein